MKNTGFSVHDRIYINRRSTSVPHNMTMHHYHDTYEIFVLLEGKRYVFCGDQCHVMQRGDVSIHTPFSIHSGQSRDAAYYDRYVLNFDEKILLNILSENELKQLMAKVHNSFFHLPEAHLSFITGALTRLEALEKSRRGLDEKKISALLLLLIDFVAAQEETEQVAVRHSVPMQIKEALAYMNQHYGEELSLDMLADKVHLSKYHFSHMFKEATGVSVMEYLTALRLTKVHNMLLYTDKKIVEIAEQTGFGSYMNLERAFKKVYGISPVKFKKQD